MTKADDVLFSVITPVYDTDPLMLRDAIESVLHQTHERWELCLVDDASTRQDTRDVLNHYAHFNDRVRVHYRTVNGGIAAASNDAMAMAEGDWVALLDHDDVLHPEALSSLARALVQDPDTDVFYTDEDKFDRPGHHFDAYRKPAWSPDALLEQMYVGHLTAYRRSVVQGVGGFRLGYEGSQDWDLLLRVTETTDRIRHVASVLYHWRSHAASTAAGGAVKPWAAIAAERALNDALNRRGMHGHVEYLPDLQHFRVRRHLEVEPLVSVIIPSAGGSRDIGGRPVRLLDQALSGLLHRNDYPNIEVILVLSAHTDPAVEFAARALVDEVPLTVLHSTGRFDFSRAINRGAAHATGDYLLLLNDDVEPITSDWLRSMVEAASAEGVGAVGARLLYGDGRLQHAGVVHNRGLPFHLHAGQSDGPGYFAEVALTRNYLAVTGACLLTPRVSFEQVGGLSELFPMNYNDIDYCLKLLAQGQRSVYVGHAVLHHYESSSRDPGVTVQEIDAFLRWWRDVTDPDPYLPAARVPLSAP